MMRRQRFEEVRGETRLCGAMLAVSAAMPRLPVHAWLNRRRSAGVDPASLADSLRASAGWGSAPFRVMTWRKPELVHDLLLQARHLSCRATEGHVQMLPGLLFLVKAHYVTAILATEGRVQTAGGSAVACEGCCM